MNRDELQRDLFALEATLARLLMADEFDADQAAMVERAIFYTAAALAYAERKFWFMPPNFAGLMDVVSGPYT